MSLNMCFRFSPAKDGLVKVLGPLVLQRELVYSS